MKKNFLLLLSLFLVVSMAAMAAPRSYQQAKAIAMAQAAKLGIQMDERVVASQKAAPRMSAPSRVSPSTDCYYVFANGNDKGFIIVSGDDRLPEVVGYSDQGTYDADHLPANYVSFMKAYQETVEALLRGDASARCNVAEAQQLRASQTSPVVAPLLGHIEWNQSAPYNNMCPFYDVTKQSVTGCVATAMAQIMAYYRYPKQLMATIPAYTAKSYSIAVPSIAAGETYDWANMLDSYSASYTQAQVDAVAKLMYHCGAAVQMNYGPSSGANCTPARLAKYFGYDADLMQDISRTNFSFAEWTSLIDRELVAGRPVYYSGKSSDGGHAFILDGADGSGLYHVNWGWGGSQNGYFDVAVLNPKKGGAGSGNSIDGYNRDGSMIIGIAPDNGKVDDPLASYPAIMSANSNSDCGLKWTSATRANSSQTFSGSVTCCFINQSTEEIIASFAFGIKNPDGTYSKVSNQVGRYKIPGVTETGSSYGTYNNLPTMTINYAFPVGKTVLYALYSTDGTNWLPCAYLNNSPYIVEATATSISTLPSPLTAKVEAEDGVYVGMGNPLKVTLTNQMDKEFNGLVNVYTSSTATQPSSKTSDVYVSVPANGSATYLVNVTPSATGNLYLWLTDTNNQNALLVNGQTFQVSQASDPVFTLVSATSNATTGKYAVGKYYENDMKLPQVDDDKLVVTYGVKNTGGTGMLDYCIVYYNAETMKGKIHTSSVRAAGNGAVTYVTQEIKPSSVNSNSILTYFNLYDFTAGQWATIDCTIPDYYIYSVTTSGRRVIKGNALIAYVTGVASSISSVEASDANYVQGGKGFLAIKSDKACRMPIYHVGGQKVAEVTLSAGQEQTVQLRPGIYIVAGTKVVVR